MPPPDLPSPDPLQRESSLTRNAFYNVAGSALPLFLSVVTIPLYLSKVGDARYGVIALVWLLFGYFGLFDLGLSQATANRLARPDNQSPGRQSELFWTAVILNAIFGIAGGGVFLLGAGFAFDHWPLVSPDLSTELKSAIPWIAGLIPLSTISGVLFGTLESRERFLELNALQLGGAAFIQLAPIAAIYLYQPTIEVAIASTALARAASMLPAAILAVRQAGGMQRFRLQRSTLRDLLGYGGWVTVTNIINPILVSIDQFMIGAMLGVRSVPLYSIPFNMAMKLRLVPQSMTRALFPRMSKGTLDEARHRAEAVAVSVALVMAMFCVPGMFIVEAALHVWLGKAFSAQASTVTRILLLGVWINGVAMVPYAYLQSQGRPDLPAKLHAAELLPFIALLWACVEAFGLTGAAMAWSIRVAVDACFLIWRAGFDRRTKGRLSAPLPALVSAFALATWAVDRPLAQLACAVVSLAAVAAYAYWQDDVLKRAMARVLRQVRPWRRSPKAC